MTFSPEIAEDVASDAWIDVIRGMSRFRGDERAFRSWLFTIARRRLIDRQRKAMRVSETLTGEIEREAAALEFVTEDVGELVAEQFAADEAIALVRKVLSADQAEVVLLRVIGGFSVDETAEITNRSPGAVRVHQHRGLRRLAEHLQDGLAPRERNLRTIYGQV